MEWFSTVNNIAEKGRPDFSAILLSSTRIRIAEKPRVFREPFVRGISISWIVALEQLLTT